MPPPSSKRIKLDHDDNNDDNEDEMAMIERGYQLEANVGITEFIGEKHPSFIGILKHRFEDFIVHEIDRKGNVIKLENIDPPEDIFKIIEKDQMNEKPQKDDDVFIQIDDLKIDVENFKNSIKNYIESDYKSDCPLIEIDELDKQQRTCLHFFIKQNYIGLESRTETIDNKKVIRIVQRKQLSKNDRRSLKPKWPTDKPNYVHFVLYKQNIDTQQVVNELTGRMKLKTKNFSFTGTKDKRAITTQLFSAFQINPIKIWRTVNEFNRQNRRNNSRMNVGHFRFEPEILRLGDSGGNQFDIILRNVHLVKIDDDDNLKNAVAKSFESIQLNGFINYYGMQRFGSHHDSHKLGVWILRKDLKKLCEGILVEKFDYSQGQNHNIQSFNKAIRIWKETGDASEAYKNMYQKSSIEGSLLRGLAKSNPNDYQSAICIGLSRNSRLLYLHAYQSYLWNKTASFRIKEYGLNVVPGDLVMIGDEDDFDDEQNDNDDGKEEEEQEEKLKLSSKNTSNNIKSNIPDEKIQLVTEETVSKYTIFDIVLPIIGALSKFPQNNTKKFIDKLMEDDNISIEQFKSLSNDWCCNGSYRKLLIRPENLNYEWIEYFNDNKPLIQSDLDLINKQQKQKKEEEAETKELGSNNNDNDDNLDKTGKKLALKIHCKLSKSCYATMFLRELTKISSISLKNYPGEFGLLKQSNVQPEKEVEEEIIT